MSIAYNSLMFTWLYEYIQDEHMGRLVASFLARSSTQPVARGTARSLA